MANISGHCGIRMSWSVEPENRCTIRYVNYDLDKVSEVIAFEPKKLLIVKTSPTTTLELKYNESTKMYQCIQDKNIFVSLGPDWYISDNK